jgi:hypothetical protein
MFGSSKGTRGKLVFTWSQNLREVKDHLKKEDEDEDEEEERIMSIGGYILEKKNVILPCSNKNPPPLPFALCSC